MHIKSERIKAIRFVLWLILALNLLVAAAKIITGFFISSMAMTADGFHSLTDSISNVAGLIGIAFAYRPVDEDHPYGHGKMETITSLFMAGMLMLLSAKLVADAVTRIFSEVKPVISWYSLLVLVGTLIINIFVYIYESRRGKELQSSILITDATHTKSDIFISIGVLLSLILIRLGLPPIVDPIVSLLVAGFVLKAGYDIFTFTRDVLVDKAILDNERIKTVVKSFEDVRDVHKIRSRGTALDCHVDMHIWVNPAMSVTASHELVHDIEKAIIEDFGMNIQVFAHIEPCREKEQKNTGLSE